MADIKKEVLIDIVVSNDEAVKGIVAAKEQLRQLKEEQNNLTQMYKEGAITAEEYDTKMVALTAAQKEYTSVVKANEKELSNNIKAQKEASDSLVAMRAELSNATKAYDNLSQAERQGAKGQEMLNHIQSLTQNLMLAEEESGRFGRNVGNYPQFMNPAATTVGKVAGALKGFSGGTVTAAGALKGMASTVKLVSKELLAMMSIPIIAVISAIAFVVIELVKAFKKNDDAMTALQESFQVLTPIIDAVKAVFEAIVGVITKVITGFTKVAETIMSKLSPAYAEAIEKNRELVKAQDELQEAERRYTVDSAARSLEVAKLRDKAAQKDKYSAEERKKFLSEAIELEKKDMEERKRNADETLRLAKAQAERDKDTSDETKDRIAELEAAAIKAEEEFYTGTLRLQRQYQSAVNEMEKEQIKAAEDAEKERQRKAKEWAEKRKQMLDEEKNLVRTAVQMSINSISDMGERASQQLQFDYENAIQDLQDRLAQGGLTKTARRAINDQIAFLRNELKVKTAALAKEVAENAAKATEDEIAAKAKEVEDALKKRMEGYAKDDAKLKAEQNAMLYEAQAQWEKQLTDLELSNTYGREVQKAQIMEEQALQRFEIARNEYNRLNEMDEQERLDRYGTMEAYNAARAEANLKMIQEEDNVRKAMKRVEQEQLNQQRVVADSKDKMVASMQGMLQSVQGLFEGMAEENEKYADFATAMAMMNILVSSAISIAQAIQGATTAAAAGGPAAPFLIAAYVAEMVAIVASGIASATQTLNKAKEQKQAYATGGYVEGPGTGTSDSIDAKLSNGEFVVNAAATRRFLPELVAINGGWGNTGGRAFASGGYISYDAAMGGYNTEYINSTIAEAVANIHPVVSVKEITRVSNRVSVKENISKR